MRKYKKNNEVVPLVIDLTKLPIFNENYLLNFDKLNRGSQNKGIYVKNDILIKVTSNQYEIERCLRLKHYSNYYPELKSVIPIIYKISKNDKKNPFYYIEMQKMDGSLRDYIFDHFILELFKKHNLENIYELMYPFNNFNLSKNDEKYILLSYYCKSKNDFINNDKYILYHNIKNGNNVIDNLRQYVTKYDKNKYFYEILNKNTPTLFMVIFHNLEYDCKRELSIFLEIFFKIGLYISLDDLLDINLGYDMIFSEEEINDCDNQINLVLVKLEKLRNLGDIKYDDFLLVIEEIRCNLDLFLKNIQDQFIKIETILFNTTKLMQRDKKFDNWLYKKNNNDIIITLGDVGGLGSVEKYKFDYDKYGFLYSGDSDIVCRKILDISIGTIRNYGIAISDDLYKILSETFYLLIK